MTESLRQASSRRRTVVLLAAVALTGLSAKFFPFGGSDWPAKYGAGVFYEIFWILLIFFFVPRRDAAVWGPAGVFAATCFLEWLQGIRFPALDALRSNFAGEIILGQTYDPADFIFYGAGCLLGGWMVLKIYDQSTGPIDSDKLKEG